MADIKISNLNPAGSDFFNDSESFMTELTDEQIKTTHGGSTAICYIAIGYLLAQ